MHRLALVSIARDGGRFVHRDAGRRSVGSRVAATGSSGRSGRGSSRHRSDLLGVAAIGWTCRGTARCGPGAPGCNAGQQRSRGGLRCSDARAVSPDAEVRCFRKRLLYSVSDDTCKSARSGRLFCPQSTLPAVVQAVTVGTGALRCVVSTDNLIWAQQGRRRGVGGDRRRRRAGRNRAGYGDDVDCHGRAGTYVRVCVARAVTVTVANARLGALSAFVTSAWRYAYAHCPSGLLTIRI